MTRVTRRTLIVPVNGSKKFYDVQLELSTKGISQAGGDGSPGVFPHVGCSVGAIGIVQGPISANTGGVTTMPTTPTVGSLMLYFFLGRTTTAGPPLTGSWATAGSTLVIGSGIAECGVFYKVVAVGETGWDTSNIGAGGNKAYFVEFSGVDTFGVAANGGGGTATNAGTVAITPTAGKTALLVSLVGNDDDAFDQTFTPVAGMTELYEIPPASRQGTINWQAVASTSGSYTVGSTWPTNPFEPSGVIGAAFICSGGNNPPEPGRWVYNETPTMDSDHQTFHTLHPFADGSLKVTVDGIGMAQSIDAQDGAAGTFHTAFVVSGAMGDSRGEQVTVSYQGR